MSCLQFYRESEKETRKEEVKNDRRNKGGRSVNDEYKMGRFSG